MVNLYSGFYIGWFAQNTSLSTFWQRATPQRQGEIIFYTYLSQKQSLQHQVYKEKEK
jgi:hypothetical protein